MAGTQYDTNGVVATENYLAFCGWKDTRLSPFSFNDFKDGSGLVWASAEHYLGFAKAKLFDREDLKPRIRALTTGYDVRKLVREEVQTEWATWRDAAPDICNIVVRYMVESNKRFREELLSYPNLEILYCNDRDILMGTGVGLDQKPEDYLVSHRDKFGNIWGKALEKVRDRYLDMEEVMVTSSQAPGNRPYLRNIGGSLASQNQRF